MNSKLFKYPVVLGAALTGLVANAAASDEIDGPSGIKIGERMTLRPYVSLSYTYDSNVDSQKESRSGSQFSIRPNLELDYKGDNFLLSAQAWYQYHAYERYSNQLNSQSYGEDIAIDWANSAPNEKGWKFRLSERFEQIAQDDDMSGHDGRGIGRDRTQLNADAMLERRITEGLHAAIYGGYYYLDYANDVKSYAPLYGWQRWNIGAEVGWAASKWTDFVLSGNYQGYRQDNSNDKERELTSARGKRIAADSKGWTLHAGIATRATERITYRVLGGWSRFEYAGGANNSNGFTYSFSGNWVADDAGTLSFSALGASYYQSSETTYGSSTKTYTASVGLRKKFVRAKLDGTLNLTYRREGHEYSEYASGDSDRDIWTGRLGLIYRLNRYFQIFGTLEYQRCFSRGGSDVRNTYDYDRFRGTVGVRLTY